MIRSLVILGSTGSIGTQALEVCQEFGIEVRALACHSQVDLLYDQIQTYRPLSVAVSDPEASSRLTERLRSTPGAYSCPVRSGHSAVTELAAGVETDMVLGAMVGMVGIEPILAAVRAGRDIALANKEVLVVAGDLLMAEAKRYQVEIHPVDSEHSAIRQCLMSGKREELHKVFLTASGGPFRGLSLQDLATVTVADALRHPTWQMGAKITIDSATLMNKGLELIEAARLFDLTGDQIEVVVHPQSIIHSFVEWQDGSLIAQMGMPDMKLPIQLAFSWPDRACSPDRRFNPFDPAAATLSFEAVDTDVFRSIPLAYEALRVGGTLPLAFNSAGEVAVAAFLDGRISFLRIAQTVETMMEQHIQEGFILRPTLDAIMETDRLLRQKTKETIGWIE